jgi:two-component system, chemotaxis family, protein-glutamate methylesterase/glutaminase
MEPGMIRVMVAEDSAVTREYLDHLLNQDPALQVIGTVQNGLEAVEQAQRLRPDVILMDVHMPLMNGYEATRQIMERIPTPIVMISSNMSHDHVAMTFEALKAGALTVLEKPYGLGHPDSGKTVSQLQETVRLMAGVKVIRRWPRRDHPSPVPMLPARTASDIQLIVIGASTGGPTVIVEILGSLPLNFPIPILVVQHIATGFAPGLVKWVGQSTPLHVKLAESGETAQPGTVYLAPHHTQMGITKDQRIYLTKRPTENHFCPSVSYLFESVAKAFGRSAMGILLTGMGQDGAGGLLQLSKAGGVTIAQDEETSVIFGMPGEAIRLGAAQYVLSPRQIAELLRGLV